jgi:hypothetical protein
MADEADPAKLYEQTQKRLRQERNRLSGVPVYVPDPSDSEGVKLAEAIQARRAAITIEIERLTAELERLWPLLPTTVAQAPPEPTAP